MTTKFYVKCHLMGLVKEELKKIDHRSRGDARYSDGFQLTIQR